MTKKKIETESEAVTIVEYVPARQRFTNGKTTLSVNKEDREFYLNQGFVPIEK